MSGARDWDEAEQWHRQDANDIGRLEQENHELRGLVAQLQRDLAEAREVKIQSRCPSCNFTTLVLNKGHILCTWHECKAPCPTMWQAAKKD